MNYARIIERDIANGIGVRVSLFVSGCNRHCKGCFNPETWDFNYGKPFDTEIQNKIIELLSPNYVAGLSILGGEPFEDENVKVLYPFIINVRRQYPDKNIWIYSGNTLEELLSKNNDIILSTLRIIDTLVDGAFIEEKRNLMLEFRGSENQRILKLSEINIGI